MMDLNRIKLLIVTLVALLSLALGASSALAHHDKGHQPNQTPAALKCGHVLYDQAGNQNGWTTNCDHKKGVR
jgi:hypothetical protein